MAKLKKIEKLKFTISISKAVHTRLKKLAIKEKRSVSAQAELIIENSTEEELSK